MAQEYDKERAMALIKQARDLTAQLKAEMEEIKTQMDTVLDEAGDNSDRVEQAALDANILSEVAPKKTVWWRWR